jgi:autotransporter adhesin
MSRDTLVGLAMIGKEQPTVMPLWRPWAADRGLRRRAPKLIVGFALAIVAFGLSNVSAVAGCSSGNVAMGSLLSSADCQANANGSSATAVGTGAIATGTGGTAFGRGARASSLGTVAIGFGPYATGLFATSVGYNGGANSAVAGATTVGAWSGADGAGSFSTALGAGTDKLTTSGAAGNYSIAIGGGDGADFFDKKLIGARATRFMGIAIGTTSAADSDFAVAFGFNARAGTGVDIVGPIAIGADALASLTNATALGRFSTATEEDSTALGSASAASSAGGLALGFDAKASKRNAVALGSRSVANVANTVSVGRAGAERRVMNVAAAVLNTDAVNLAQVKALVATAVQQSRASIMLTESRMIKRDTDALART